MSKESLSHDFLLSLYSYDPQTGLFTLRINRGKHRMGQVAKTLNAHGYVIVGICRQHYLAHRLAWFYMHGVWPEAEIDHINHDRKDNRWSNLRASDRSQNNRNSRTRSDNRCGFRGIHVQTGSDRWKAVIRDGEKCAWTKTARRPFPLILYLIEQQRLRYGEFFAATEDEETLIQQAMEASVGPVRPYRWRPNVQL